MIARCRLILLPVVACLTAGCPAPNAAPPSPPAQLSTPTTEADDEPDVRHPELLGTWHGRLAKRADIWSEHSGIESIEGRELPGSAARERLEANGTFAAEAPTATLDVQLTFEPKHLQFPDLIGCLLAITLRDFEGTRITAEETSIFFKRDASRAFTAKSNRIECILGDPVEHKLPARISVFDVDGQVLHIPLREITLARNTSSDEK